MMIQYETIYCNANEDIDIIYIYYNLFNIKQVVNYTAWTTGLFANIESKILGWSLVSTLTTTTTYYLQNPKFPQNGLLFIKVVHIFAILQYAVRDKILEGEKVNFT